MILRVGIALVLADRLLFCVVIYGSNCLAPRHGHGSFTTKIAVFPIVISNSLTNHTENKHSIAFRVHEHVCCSHIDTLRLQSRFDYFFSIFLERPILWNLIDRFLLFSNSSSNLFKFGIRRDSN